MTKRKAYAKTRRMIRDRRARRFWSMQGGSFTVEAALLLPIILSFVLTLISFVQISVAQLALESAAMETSRQVTGHWYPVRLIYSEAKEHAESSLPGQGLKGAISRVEEARGRITDAEDWMDRYEQLIPDPLIKIMRWEQERRQSLEADAANRAAEEIKSVIDPLLCSAFQPIVVHYANLHFLKEENLHVDQVKLPSFEEGGDPYFSLSVSYQLKLPVPWMNKTITIRSKVYERAWVGET